MQCVFLAAGYGKRLRPYTETTPKHLLEINGMPILEHNFACLSDGVDKIVLVVGWLGEKIRAYFGNKFSGREIIYIEQKERLGTGHALTLCQNVLQDKFMVMMGDNFYGKDDIKKCLRHQLCLLTIETNRPKEFAVVEVNDDGSLKEVKEKPHNSLSNLINTGLYVLDRRIFDYPPVKIASGEYGLPQTIGQMAKDHKVYIEKTAFWIPVDTMQDFQKAREYFKLNFTGA